jgi:hypothetical protein
MSSILACQGSARLGEHGLISTCDLLHGDHHGCKWFPSVSTCYAGLLAAQVIQICCKTMGVLQLGDKPGWGSAQIACELSLMAA